MSVILAFALASTIEPLRRFPNYQGLSDETKVAVAPYWNCVMEHAEKLEPSKEASGIVVKAAFAACHEKKLDLQAGMDVDLIMAESEQRSDGMLSKFESEIEAAAILLVVEIRNRKAK